MKLSKPLELLATTMKNWNYVPGSGPCSTFYLLMNGNGYKRKPFAKIGTIIENMSNNRTPPAATLLTTQTDNSNTGAKICFHIYIQICSYFRNLLLLYAKQSGEVEKNNAYGMLWIKVWYCCYVKRYMYVGDYINYLTITFVVSIHLKCILLFTV